MMNGRLLHLSKGHKTRPCRLEVIARAEVRMEFTTWQGMSLNGALIGMTKIIIHTVQSKIHQVRKTGIPAYCEAVRGIILDSSYALPIAIGMHHQSVVRLTVFGVLGMSVTFLNEAANLGKRNEVIT